MEHSGQAAFLVPGAVGAMPCVKEIEMVRPYVATGK
jgi:hypothetical protein